MKRRPFVWAKQPRRAQKRVRMCRAAGASILRQPPSPIPRPRSRAERLARRARPASRSFVGGRRRAAARLRWTSHKARRGRTRGFGRGEGRGLRSCRGCEGCPARSRSGPGRRGRAERGRFMDGLLGIGAHHEGDRREDRAGFQGRSRAATTLSSRASSLGRRGSREIVRRAGSRP